VNARVDLRFYGWRIVGVALLCHFVAVGLSFYSFGVFFKPIAAELGASRFALSLGQTITTVAAALCAPLVGRAVERGSARRITIAGALAFGVGYGLSALARELWQLYAVLATFIGFGAAALGNIPQATLVARWFTARRGTALGLAAVGVSLSGLVMPALATGLIAAIGWRGGYGVYALAAVVLVVPAARVIVDRPEDLGLVADGARGGDPAPEARWTTPELLRSRAFWCISAAFALGLFAVSAVLTHLVPLLTDAGVDPLVAAGLLSATAACGIVGKLGFGHVADALDARASLALSLLLQLGGVLLLWRADGSAWLALGALVFGLGMGGVVPLQSTLTASAFGTGSFARASGLMRPVMLPLTASGVAFAGLMFDRLGSYLPALAVFAVGYLLALIACALLPTRAATLERTSP
jgi:predicted MFS family arabinose efflux permease